MRYFGISGILWLYKSNVLSFSFTYRTLTNVTATFFTIHFVTLLAHHNMPTTCIDHTWLRCATYFTLLFIVILIWCAFCLWFFLLKVWLINWASIGNIFVLTLTFILLRLFFRFLFFMLWLYLWNFILIKRKRLK